MKVARGLLFLCVAVLAFPQTITPNFTHNRFTENGKTYSQDGSQMVSACLTTKSDELSTTAAGQISAELCAGYVEGIADLLSESDVCIPPETKGQQLEEIFLQYASKHQSLLHGPASAIVAAALRETYPCRATAKK